MFMFPIFLSNMYKSSTTISIGILGLNVAVTIGTFIYVRYMSKQTDILFKNIINVKELYERSEKSSIAIESRLTDIESILNNIENNLDNLYNENNKSISNIKMDIDNEYATHNNCISHDDDKYDCTENSTENSDNKITNDFINNFINDFTNDFKNEFENTNKKIDKIRHHEKRVKHDIEFIKECFKNAVDRK